jgi:predicted DCC family thiol-disulfide oxidoreductase YuxK
VAMDVPRETVRQISTTHQFLNFMNTLHNHVIIYDKDCPLCNLYTGAFVKTNMLDKNGRLNFSDLNTSNYPCMDVARSRDEIALINTQTGNITYGIDSLFKILSNAIPALRLPFCSNVFRYAMRKLYSFVSYNRKVIAPAKEFELPGSCTPSFNLKYRWAYIIVSWIFTSIVLSRFAVRLEPMIPSTNFFREWLICGGQIVFQSIAIRFMRKERVIHYLGNMMTVSNIGALFLIPALWFPITNPTFFIIWFGAVVTFMLFEHFRRAKILGLSVWASVSWVLYRILVLALIFLV